MSFDELEELVELACKKIETLVKMNDLKGVDKEYFYCRISEAMTVEAYACRACDY